MMAVGSHPVPLATVALALALTSACTGTVRPVVPLPSEPAPASSVAAPRPSAPVPAPPRFAASISRVHAATLGWSWREGCPVPVHDLRLLRMRHWGFDGEVHTGRMVVHERWARPVADVFRRLFAVRFPIEKMVLANAYPPNDRRREAANITTAFVCRASVGDRRRWSEHAYGRAVDINPLQNPYVSRRGVIPDPWGRAYLDRDVRRPGMIRRGDVVWRAFRSIGWRWGGEFRRSKDYHHFSATGR